MTHPYKAVVTRKAKTGMFPAIAGEIYEKGVLIGTFARKATVNGFVPPITWKFRSSQSQARFEDFSDSLTISETIEALI